MPCPGPAKLAARKIPHSEGTAIKRFHVHLHVDDLGLSVAFYNKLFAAAPARLQADYAKWMLDDPPLNFAISTRGSRPGIDHLGIQTDSANELDALKVRAQAADLALHDEGQTTCCYARSQKHWVTDPQGTAWEHFHTLGDIPVFNEAATPAISACCTSTQTAAATRDTPEEGATACCATAPRGKPMGIAVKPDSSCC